MDAKDEIKDRLSVEEVVGDYLALRPSGRNLKALSPFTPEKTPSFMVSPEKQIWHDFSSNKGGDIFSFVMEMEGIDFKGALELLARKAGIDLEQYRVSSVDNGVADLKKRLIKANTMATDYFQRKLIKDKIALDYLKSRGYSKETIIEFKIGWAPNDYDGLLKYLLGKGFTEDEIVKSGLAKRKGDKIFDSFRSRITVPLADSMGDYIGFTARVLQEVENAPKYLNTGSTLIYDKSRHVFGLHLAKKAIREADCAVITEGNMDVVASHQAKVKNVVATAGTAITSHHIKQIERLSRNIKLAFDSDRAGLEATERGIVLAQERKINLSIITIPEGKDPDDLIKKDPKLWEQAIRKSQDAIDWLIDFYAKQFDITKTAGKRQFSDKMSQILSKITDPVEQDSTASKIAAKLEVNKEAVLRKLQIEQSAGSKKSYKRSKVVVDELQRPEQLDVIIDSLLAVCIGKPELAKYLDGIEPELFSEFQQSVITSLQDSSSNRLNKDEERVKILMFKNEELYGTFEPDDLVKEAQKLRSRLDQLIKSKKQRNLASQIEEAEEANDQVLLQKLSEEFNKLVKKN